MRLLFSQLVNKLLFPHMASLLHIQTQRWVKCSILTLLFPHCLVGTFWLMSLSQAHTQKPEFYHFYNKNDISLILENYKIFYSKEFWNPTWPFSEPVLVKADELSCHFLMSTLQLLVMCLASAKMSQYMLIKCLPLRRNLKGESVARLRNTLKMHEINIMLIFN